MFILVKERYVPIAKLRGSITVKVSREARRFTLVEMLVVIAIISILSALLMPGIEKAIAASRQIECSNQLRQIGYTIHSYAEDNKSLLPPFRGRMWRGGKFSKEYWPVFLSADLDKTYVNGRVSKLFLCPTDPMPREDDKFYFGYTTYGSYGVNNACLPGFEDKTTKITTFKGSTIMLSDNTNFKLTFDPKRAYFPKVFWHIGKVNTLYIDLSINPMYYDQLAGRNN